MKRKISMLLALLLLMLPVTAFAAEESQWVLSQDQKVLCYGDEEFTRYYLNPTDVLLPEEIYILDKTGLVDIDGELYQVLRPEGNDEIVGLTPEYHYYRYCDRLYVTQTGAAMLDRFVAGEYGSYLLVDEYLSEAADLTSAQVEALDALQTNASMQVTALRDAECYQIIGLDEMGTVGHIHGAVYITLDGSFYINYDELDNTYFSSDGAFSYRSGTVELVRLEGDGKEAVTQKLLELRDLESGYYYESDDLNLDMEQDNVRIVFWVLTVLLGVILPAVPLTFGLVYALGKKSLYPKRWYLLVALSIGWMLVMGGILLLLIL